MSVWTDYVRSWATKHNVSYKEALKSPQMKSDYHSTKPKKEKATPKSKKEKETEKPKYSPVKLSKTPPQSGMSAPALIVSSQPLSVEKPIIKQRIAIKRKPKKSIPIIEEEVELITNKDIENIANNINNISDGIPPPVVSDIQGNIYLINEEVPIATDEGANYRFKEDNWIEGYSKTHNNRPYWTNKVTKEQTWINPYKTDEVEGTGFSVGDFRSLLKASYDKKPANVADWNIDPTISTPEVKVYKKDGDVAVVHRGTSSLKDWGTNIAQTFGITTPRMIRAREAQRQAERKYGKENITTLGHSAGGRWAEKFGKDTKQVLTLNKPTLFADIGKSAPSHQTDFRSAGDPISILRGLEKGKKAVTIASKTSNPLAEHRTDVLSRLPQEQLIGQGISVNQDIHNYGMMMKHLLSHIIDPSEPIDPKDYDQMKKLVDIVRQIKSGMKGGGYESSSDDDEVEGEGLKPKADYITQSIMFMRERYTPIQAKRWLKEHKHRAGKMDTTEDYLRFRQSSPTEIKKKGYTEFRTEPIGDGSIKLIIAYKK